MSHRIDACLLFALLLLLVARPAWTQSIVDLCVTDVQPGRGTNLATAVARGGRVTFTCLPGTVITMTRGHAVPTGTIIDGARRIILDARGTPMTMFAVGRGSFTAEGITIRNVNAHPAGKVGRLTGSVVHGSGDVTLIDVVIESSERPVMLDGTGRLTRCRLAGNRETAVRIVGQALIADSAFMNNGIGLSIKRGVVSNSSFSQHSGGAIQVHFPSGDVTITRSRFDGNVTNGALSLSQESLRNAKAVVTVKRSTFMNNVHAIRGGAVAIVDRTTQNPTASVRAQLRSFGPASVVLAYNRFIGNRGLNGGAVDADLRNTAGMLVKGGIFLENQALEGGGAIAWQGRGLLVTHSLFRANRAARGGALYGFNREAGAKWTIANSLIAENVVPGGGVIDAEAVALVNITVARNTGIGIISSGVGSNRPTVSNAILSENSAGNCQGLAAGAFQGRNLQFGQSDCPGVTAEDPQLDSLYVPSIGSAALTMGDVTTCRASPVSRRDIVFQSRATGRRCAVGAFEGPPIRRVSLKARPREQRTP
jgi:hypothetical protein